LFFNCPSRNKLHPCRTRNLRALSPSKWLLLRHRNTPPRLFPEHRLWRRLGHGGRNVSGACHQAVGKRDQIPAKFWSVKSWKLSSHTYRLRQRKQVRWGKR